MSELTDPPHMLSARATGVRVLPVAPRGMLTIRADFNALKVGDVLAKSFGLAFPNPGYATGSGARSLLWMSPDEALLICPPSETAFLRDAADEALSRLPDAHFLLAEVSDARVSFRVEGGVEGGAEGGTDGTGARDALAKLTPADMRPGALAQGQVRRTRLGQVAAAIWMPDASGFEVLCFRSVQTYMARLLDGAATAAAPVGHLHRG